MAYICPPEILMVRGGLLSLLKTSGPTRKHIAQQTLEHLAVAMAQSRGDHALIWSRKDFADRLRELARRIETEDD